MILTIILLVLLAIPTGIALGTYQWFMVIVPEFTALAVLDLFTGKMEVLRKKDNSTSGFFLKSPFKQVKPGNFVSLVKITVLIKQSFVAKDGSVVWANGIIQYRSQDTNEGILKYLMAEDIQIVNNMMGRVKTHLTKDIADDTYETVRTHILDIAKDLSALYEGKGGQEKQMKDIENQFGVIIEYVNISDVGYDEKSQTAISDRFALNVLKDAHEPTNGQLLMLDKNISKSVFGLDLGSINPQNIKDLGRNLEEIMKSPAGPVLAAALGAAAASRGGSGGGKNPKKEKTKMTDPYQEIQANLDKLVIETNKPIKNIGKFIGVLLMTLVTGIGILVVIIVCTLAKEIDSKSGRAAWSQRTTVDRLVVPAYQEGAGQRLK